MTNRRNEHFWLVEASGCDDQPDRHLVAPKSKLWICCSTGGATRWTEWKSSRCIFRYSTFVVSKIIRFEEARFVDVMSVNPTEEQEISICWEAQCQESLWQWRTIENRSERINREFPIMSTANLKDSLLVDTDLSKAVAYHHEHGCLFILVIQKKLCPVLQCYNRRTNCKIK